MVTVEEIKLAVKSLPKREYARLLSWISQKDWEAWDEEPEADTASGKLDFLVQEAQHSKRQNELRAL